MLRQLMLDESKIAGLCGRPPLPRSEVDVQLVVNNKPFFLSQEQDNINRSQGMLGKNQP